MSKKPYWKIAIKGDEVGLYMGEDEEEALQLYATTMDYDNVDHMLSESRRYPPLTRDDFTITEVEVFESGRVPPK